MNCESRKRRFSPSGLTHRLYDMTSPAIASLLRRWRWDVQRLDRSGITHRDLEHDLSRLVLSPSPLVFDVGANKGQTIELMRRVFPFCELHAFEPSQDLARSLHERYSSCHVVIESMALGARDGICRFLKYDNNELSSFLSLTQNSDNPFTGVDLIATEEVRVTTIDSYCATNRISAIDILKTDTQGFDLEVLKGAARLFSIGAVRLVLAEVLFIPMYESQCKPGELIDWLGAQGFALVGLYEQVRLQRALSWATACFINRLGPPSTSERGLP